MYVKKNGALLRTYLWVAGWSCGAFTEETAGMLSEVKICADVAWFLPRRLPPLQPRPPQEQHFTTRAQHLEDVQNMSGSAPSRSHSTRVGKHRTPFIREIPMVIWQLGGVFNEVPARWYTRIPIEHKAVYCTALSTTHSCTYTDPL